MNPLTFRQFISLSEQYVREPNSQLGSNPGGVYTDSVGKRFYIKYPKSDTQARVEVATGQIYSKLGIKTLNPELESSTSRIGVKTPWNESTARLMPHEFHEHIESSPSFRKGILDIYHASALTNNWDAVGLAHDNILKDTHTGLPVSIDHGGSMNFRAQGEPKEFSSTAKPELSSLLNTRRPSGHVFKYALDHSNYSDVSESREKLRNLQDSDIDEICHKNGLSSIYSATLKSRRDSILGDKE